MQKIILLLPMLFCFATNIRSQSAVYWDRNNGSVGMVWDAPNLEKAEDSAYKACISAGGVSPLFLASTADKGFGAALSGFKEDGNRIISAAVGMSTEDEAVSQARYDCEYMGATKESISIVQKWEDK